MAENTQNWDSYNQAANDRKRSINELPLSPDPNVLHKFASYNTLFTLSALSQQEIRNPKQFFQGAPHDIIARSGGIGAAANRNERPAFEQDNQFTDETKKTIIKN